MLTGKTPIQIIITGNPALNPTTSGMISAIQRKLLPQKVLILADGNPESILYKNLKILSNVSASGDSLEYLFLH